MNGTRQAPRTFPRRTATTQVRHAQVRRSTVRLLHLARRQARAARVHAVHRARNRHRRRNGLPPRGVLAPASRVARARARGRGRRRSPRGRHRARTIGQGRRRSASAPRRVDRSSTRRARRRRRISETVHSGGQGQVRSVSLLCRDCPFELLWPVQSYGTVPPPAVWRKLFEHVATHPPRPGRIDE